MKQLHIVAIEHFNKDFTTGSFDNGLKKVLFQIDWAQNCVGCSLTT